MTNTIETHKAALETKCAELRAKIEANPMPLDVSQEWESRSAELISQIGNVDKMSDDEKADFRAKFAEIGDKGSKAADVCTLASYEETLASDLVIIETDFAITSEASLFSPAGFHPDTRVFVQPTICIQTNLDPRKPSNRHLIPNSNMTLYCNKLAK